MDRWPCPRSSAGKRRPMAPPSAVRSSASASDSPGRERGSRPRRGVPRGGVIASPSVERTPTFQRLFVANRGEVAARIARSCDDLGITPVFAVSEADRSAPYTRGREVVVVGPARSAQSYLDVEKVVQAAVQTRCSALHPGWGFLSENPLLAQLCAQHGVTFIGPPPHVTTLMGSKTRAKAAMRAAGMQVIPGSEGVLA